MAPGSFSSQTRPNEGHGGLSRKLVFAVSEKGMA